MKQISVSVTCTVDENGQQLIEMHGKTCISRTITAFLN